MEKFTAILEKIDGAVWGIPLIVLILAGGFLLTVRLAAFRYVISAKPEAHGEK